LPERAPATNDGEEPTSNVNVPAAPIISGQPKMVAIERIERSPEQPRKRFDESALAELAESIRAQGIIQPIVVTSLSGGRYRLLAGERRWRAAQLAGLHEVPVFIRETPEQHQLEVALIENIQRADLNAIEEAKAYDRLIEQHGYTQDELATRVGKERSTIANSLRLLKLPTKVQAMVLDATLSMGHARALLGLSNEGDMIEVAQNAVARKLSVRAIEAEVRKRLRPMPTPDGPPSRRALVVDELEQRLRRNLGVQVRLRTGKNPDGPGRIEVPYANLNELDRLLQTLLGQAET
jgi:ParB family chromosome partitioning protein